MNDQTDHVDSADEDILTYTVSDEALEVIAREARATFPTIFVTSKAMPYCC